MHSWKYKHARKLSDLSAGKRWLEQFHSRDTKAAKELLDSICYVREEEFVRGYFEMVENWLSTHPGVIALFAARETNRRAPYYIDRSSRPFSVDAQAHLGSEGIVANICRDISIKHNERVINHPSIEEMLSNKCKYAIFVDDIIGSGRRMREFAKSFYNNPTIKSWHSLKYIKFVSMGFSSTSTGIERAMKDDLIQEVVQCLSAPTGKEKWGHVDLSEIKSVCKKYAPRTSKPSMALGYKDTLSLLVFAHKCPNTTPAILWADKEGDWYGLLSKRPSVELEELSQLDRLINLAQREIGPELNIQDPRYSDAWRQILAVLSIIKLRRTDPLVISSMSGIRIPQVHKILERCQTIGWVNEGRLTEAGRQLLKASPTASRIEPKIVDDNTGFYYPASYRGE